MGTYSELFFFDEATAFSAGHRPCARCRKDRFNEFKTTWVAANSDQLSTKSPSVAQIDKLLHAERANRGGEKVTFEAPIQEAPSGAFIDLGGEAFLIWRGGLLRWSFNGYTGFRSIPSPDTYVRVLTPATIVRMFRAGFVPKVDATCLDGD